MHGPNVVLVRTSEEKLEQVGYQLAARANLSAGPVALVIPARGFSDAGRPGGPLHDPRADRALVRVIRSRLKEGIPMIEVDCHINEDPFAEAVMEAFDRLMGSSERSRRWP